MGKFVQEQSLEWASDWDQIANKLGSHCFSFPDRLALSYSQMKTLSLQTEPVIEQFFSDSYFGVSQQFDQLLKTIRKKLSQCQMDFVQRRFDLIESTYRNGNFYTANFATFSMVDFFMQHQRKFERLPLQQTPRKKLVYSEICSKSETIQQVEVLFQIKSHIAWKSTCLSYKGVSRTIGLKYRHRFCNNEDSQRRAKLDFLKLCLMLNNCLDRVIG